MNSLLKVSFLIQFLLASTSFALTAKKLTDDQKDELYRKGTLTVYDEHGMEKGHWEINIIPGAENVKNDAKKQWQEAFKLISDLGKREDFWKEKVGASIKDGMDFVKKSTWEHGVFAIPGDFRETKSEVKKITGFGSSAGKLKQWLEFSVKVTGRTLSSIFGPALGISYSIITPLAHIVYRPVASGTRALTAGTLWPALKYTWNGGAWVLTKGNDFPDKTNLIVSFVPSTK